ncbi:MAG: nascent polypeptide-associated complex protein [Candidatus Micrarchaeota archaeon]
MFPNMNPRQMEKIMAQMGMKTKQLNALRVIIETTEERIIINEPQIIEITMQGQKSYQISGEKITSELQIKEDDIKLVMMQTKCSEAQAKDALQKSKGDIARAIIEIGTI